MPVYASPIFVCAGRAPKQADADCGPRGIHTDVWGFASCVLHLATGQLPYKGLSHNQTLSALLKSRAPEVPSSLRAWLQHALKQSLSFDAAARPTVAHLRQVGVILVPSSTWLLSTLVLVLHGQLAMHVHLLANSEAARHAILLACFFAAAFKPLPWRREGIWVGWYVFQQST